MSNTEIGFLNSTEVPAHLAELFGEGNIAPRQTINQLSYKGRTWRRIVDGQETPLTRLDKESGDTVGIPIVNLVILDYNKNRSRAYYEGGFDDTANKKPSCASMDGVTPDAMFNAPYAPTCATCPYAVKGSEMTPQGKAVTACKPNKRVAVVPSQAIATHPPMLLRMAQTSVWDKDTEGTGWMAFDQLLDQLRARGIKHTAGIEIKAKFDLNVAYPKLLFAPSRWLTHAEAVAAKQASIDHAEAIHKILNGRADQDGLMGAAAGVPPEGLAPGGVVDPTTAAFDTGAAATLDTGTAQAAAAAQAAQAATAAAAASATAAGEKAKRAAAKQAKLDAANAAAAAATAAAEAAAAAAAGPGDDDEDEVDASAWGAPAAAPAAPAPKAAAKVEVPTTEAASAAVLAHTPAGMQSLLENWDDQA